MVLKAFTKMYAGMAGVRLGYCLCSDPSLLDKMAAAGQHWGVSTLAQEAGLAALSFGRLCSAHRWLRSRRTRNPPPGIGKTGFACAFPPRANYLLFHSHVPDLDRRLRPHGILLRSCANYRGLGPGDYRSAVKDREKNGALLAALQKEPAANWKEHWLGAVLSLAFAGAHPCQGEGENPDGGSWGSSSSPGPSPPSGNHRARGPGSWHSCAAGCHGAEASYPGREHGCETAGNWPEGTTRKPSLPIPGGGFLVLAATVRRADALAFNAYNERAAETRLLAGWRPPRCSSSSHLI